MSAPAQVTEEHRVLVETIRSCMVISGTHHYSDDAAAQLIADNEARAVGAADFALQQERNIHMTTIEERDKLRAELASLKARAERAEAELAKERARLDWIFSQDARLFSDTETSGWFLFWGDTPAYGSWQKERYDTPRAAVDAGMKENSK